MKNGHDKQLTDSEVRILSFNKGTRASNKQHILNHMVSHRKQKTMKTPVKNLKKHMLVTRVFNSTLFLKKLQLTITFDQWMIQSINREKTLTKKLKYINVWTMTNICKTLSLFNKCSHSQKELYKLIVLQDKPTQRHAYL